jgi:uncharacterized protein
VALDVETAYPREGLVRIHVREDSGGAVTLSLRVPSWAAGGHLTLRPAAGEATEQAVDPGTVTLRRVFRQGDVVELDLPLVPRFTAADPRIDAVRGCLAIERGPEVLCLESTDLAAATGGRTDDISAVRLDATSTPADVRGHVRVALQVSPAPTRSWPYSSPIQAADERLEKYDVQLVPYHDWANRGPGTMRVWLPVATGAPSQ